MATEGLMRMVESSRGKKWPPSKDAATFGSPVRSMTAEESGFISKGHGFKRERAEVIPSRSGSAPPSMEGSFSSIENLLSQQNSSMKTSLTNLNNTVDNVENEEKLRSDPAYMAYYLSNMNLNAKLPPPLTVRENHHVVRHSGGLGTKGRLTSLDDSARSLHLSQGSLSTLQEDPNDASSSRKSNDNLAEDSVAVMPVKDTVSLASYNKSLVDLIQVGVKQDFPRTPSPLYNHSLTSSLGTTDEPIDSDVHSLSPNASSVNKSKLPEPNSDSINDCPDTSASDALGRGFIPNDVPLPTTSPSAQHRDVTGNLQKDESNIEHDGSGNNASINGDLGLDLSRARAAKVDTNYNKQQEQSYGRYLPQHNLSTQQGVPYQLQGFQAQLVSQGMNHLQSRMQNLPHGYPKFSSIETQPSLHSPGVTPPLYGTATAYMTPGSPFYSNYQSSGAFPTQYGMGGYALSSTYLPSYMPGYASHGSFQMLFDATLGPSFNGRPADVSRGERIPHEGDMQHPSRSYGQHGPVLQPPFVDPLYTQYYPRLLEDSYGASIPHGHLASRGVVRGQLSQQELNVNAYRADPKFHTSTNGNLGILSPRNVGNNGSGYYGHPSGMGVVTQFPASHLGSPILPSSPMGRMNHLGRKYELRSPEGSVSGVYSGWQGQRSSILDDPRRHSLLEELKSSNTRKFELSDIAGRIVDFSVDQHGSRFIQQKLEYCSSEDKASVFKEILPRASKLMTDVFGNYVIQKFFEYGSPEQKKELADQLAGQVLPLSLQMYGCRVIQKALEVIELDQKIQLVHELDGHVMTCVRDQNGNHVIQKCIECIPTEKIGFIISAFQGQVASLSTHPYGCRVIQRVLEHCSDDLQSQCIVDEILESTYDLAQDQYGNYVTQHVLERGKPNERSQIISKLVGKIVRLSQHKYASNVVEKCLEYGDTTERELLIEEIIGQMEENDSLLPMMKDQFANYVVQKVLETSNDRQREILLKLIRVHIDALKKYTYGKHIVVRFQQLSGEDVQTPEAEGV
ncbi:pumilio homolog 5 isoform X1 [Pyrus x bretschneideri]|uniref:pumilio homolog 5 isoform X1 n=1 Tax=Pyrus x bretschneideri TaxID=225117 RepID=UPI00051123EF|nr:pumilio homolog 5 isoform X1 [Pyrus x bretschneideri]XP_009379219.1 pumilio homolog 5 isoform X1 [Pyrus x bretschneideri]XP_009379220.1 pumilio homolog 5 isoform X1 [Pyrus x bretschneideri]